MSAIALDRQQRDGRPGKHDGPDADPPAHRAILRDAGQRPAAAEREEEQQHADPDREGQAQRPPRQHELRDVRRAGRGRVVNREHVHEPAQRPGEHVHEGWRDDRQRGHGLGEEPGPTRRPVPQLGHEVGEGQDHERQRRVVVVLERGPVDAPPRDPLRGEAHRDERQTEAAPLERLVRDERHRRDAEPPDGEVAGVIDRRRRAVTEAALVEPDRLEVERPRPPRRRRGVGRRELVVVAIHLAGQLEQGLAGVPGRPARHDLVAVEGGPRQVRDDVDDDRQDDEARGGPHDGDSEQPAGPQPAGGRPRRRFEEARGVVGCRRRGQRPEAVLPPEPEQAVHDQ